MGVRTLWDDLSVIYEPGQLRVMYAQRPWTTNSERRQGHWGKRAQLTRQWREAFRHAVTLVNPPTPTRVEIDAYIWAKSGKLADCASHHPAVKAAIDGLVDAGLIPDDSPKYLSKITFHAPKRKPQDALILKVELI